MSLHTFSSRDFTRDVSAAKRAAAQGPVIITDRGRPAFTLLTFEAYKKMSGKRKATKIADLLAMPNAELIELEIPRSSDLAQSADLG
jgi:PHD/YefM family antitoxin component YafN of YafNO toxin-antitoxin module